MLSKYKVIIYNPLDIKLLSIGLDIGADIDGIYTNLYELLKCDR